MPTNFSSTTLSGFYNDDFDEQNNYHQILFNSGRALQARELTQLQSMIYQEMGRFGRNIFKEGSAVSAGPISVNSEYDYVQIASITAPNGAAFETLNQTTEGQGIEIGTIFQNQAGVRARVLAVKADQSIPSIDENTLYVQYINSNNQAISDVPVKFAPEDTITQQGGNGYVLEIASNPSANAQLVNSGVIGQGTQFSVGEGDFFVLGRFVHANAQTITLSPYSTSVDAEVGFKVVQEVVTVNDETSLYDISNGGIPNTSSPGADRYRITLSLVNKTDTTADDTFVFLARVENSKIVEEVKELDAYNKINDVMALRTNEESGNYIVNPFTLDVDSADADNLKITVSSGIAYVNGYRAEIPSAVELLVPRSIGVGETIENDVIPAKYGNYVLLDSAGKLPDLTYELLTIKNYDDVAIGTARARAIEPAGGKFKLYLFDIDITGDISQGKYLVGTVGEGYYFIDNPQNTDGLTADDYTSCQILGTTDNDLLFPTTRPRAALVDDVTLVYQKVFNSPVKYTGQLTLPAAPAGEAYTDGSQWFVVDIGLDQNNPVYNGVGIFTPDNINEVNGTIQDTQGRFVTNHYYFVYAYLQKTATIQPKTLASGSGTVSSAAGVYDLGLPDVDVVTVITNGTSAGGFDVSERFIFDDGQRDNYYANSRLLLKEGEVDPGDIWVEYQYFQRGSGDFFAPQSYSSIPYSRVPTHVLQDGTIVSLRNYIDFRPDKSSSGTFSNKKYLPRSGTSITSDVTYHLPRADKLLVTQEGDLQILMGQQSKDPQLKKTPENALELYQILMGANTADEDDVQIKAIEHKRYTMSDISKLDEKIEQLKQYTELNIAELRAYHTPSLDSAGDERPDAGMVVDDLTDQSGSQTDNDDYSASLDPENNLIRPKADEDNVRLVYDAALPSSGIVLKGDNVYLDYDEVQWQYQDLASRFVNPNPFGAVDNVGVIKLSPSSDEWKDAKQEAIKAVLGSSKLDNKQAFLWNNWQWNWKGRSDEDVWVGNDESRYSDYALRKRYQRYGDEIYNSNPNARGAVGYVRRVVRRDTLRQRIGNRIIDLALIPWMRSRKIYFKAQGLKPGTKFTPFFDGVDVSAWCKPETTFVKWSEREDDNANKYTYNSLPGHPESVNQAGEELISDANGEVIGSFWIPNLKPVYYVSRVNHPKRIRQTYLRFRAGIREFKLLDINTNDWSAASSKAFAYYSVVGAIPFKWNNIVSSRGRAFCTPLGVGFAGFPSAYSPAELKQTLDAVAAANVNIVSPQVAGLYSPETVSINPANYAGSMSSVISDYIYVNQKQFAGNNIRSVALPQNPLSQTFYVDNQFGLMLSKISLFFHSKPTGVNSTDNMPISIHIRPVVDGRPSTTEIVPDSHVFLNPGAVDAIATTDDAVPTLSVIQSRPTDFAFDEPIFLQPWTHYAIVITTQSTEYKIFSAKTLDTVYGSTSRKITTQPAPGSLFLPQNGIAWFEAKDQDLMMKISRCDFTKSLGGGSLLLRNGVLSALQLENNPIQLTSGSTTVYVKAPCSGLMAGDQVALDDCADISNVVADTYLNAPLLHTIIEADIHGFTFDYAVTVPGAPAASETVSGGGDKVLSQRNIVFDIANPNLETIVPNFTSVDMSAKFSSGVHASGDTANRFNPNGTLQDMLVANYQRITPDQNIQFDSPRAIYHSNVKDLRNPTTSGLGLFTAAPNPQNNYSAYVKIDLKTSNGYVSPIVDLQRASLSVAGECIDDGITHINYIPETQPTGGSAASKHITTPVTTEIPAVSLDIRTEASLPTNAAVDCYYRTASSDQNIAENNWVLAEPYQTVPATGSNVSTELRWLPGGQNGTLLPFQQSQVKFVLKGIDAGPQIKNISIRSLAV